MSQKLITPGPSRSEFNALSDQIASLIIKTSFAVWSSETVNANSQKYKWVSLANNCPSGYKPIAVALECSDISCIANIADGASASPYLNEATICVHNLSSQSKTVTVNIIITCLKS